MADENKNPSASADINADKKVVDSNQQQEQAERLALPGAGESTVSQEQQKKQVLEVGGEKVQLDNLGPIILNEDGTMSRITNWPEMTEMEQKNTLRVIAKRNKQRREKLEAQLKEEQGDGKKNDEL